MTVFLHIFGTVCLAYRITLIFHNRRPFFSMSWLWTALWAACILCGTGSFISGNPVPAYVMTILVAAAAVLMTYFSSLMKKACIRNNTARPDYLVVPGAHVRGNTVTRVLAWRLESALNEAEKYPGSLIITTGGRGKGENLSEAEAGRQWLMKHGVCEEYIIEENTSSSTYENLTNTLALTGRPDAVYGIVTSDFHIYRALETAKAAGMHNVYGIPARTSVLSRPHNTARESLAICRHLIITRKQQKKTRFTPH